MDAVAIYLREIRQARGLTQESLAERVGVSKRTIERFERNEGEVSASTFEQIIAALRASAQQIHYLATNAAATIDQAKSLAREWLRDNTQDQLNELADSIHSGGKMAEALALIQQLERDPAALDRLLGYGQSLLDSRQPAK